MITGKQFSKPRTLCALAAALVSWSLSFISCNSWTPVEPGLNATTSATQIGSDCAGCHAYPVGGVNHQFHLMHTADLKDRNGPITCLDCHRSALQERDQIILDTIFMNSFAQNLSSYDSSSSASFRDSIRLGRYQMRRVDTLVHHRPIPINAPAGRASFLQEWMTTANHLNGKVDVLIDSRDSDPYRYHGQTGNFDPSMQTCSSIACHLNRTAYRWPAPSESLPGLNATPNTK